MDLTNIKPCVECGKWKICFTLSSVDTVASFRIGRILVKGEDCFVEVDNETDGKKKMEVVL